MSDSNPLPVSTQRSYRTSHEVTNRLAGPVIMMMQFREWNESVNGSHWFKDCYNPIVNEAKETFPFTSLKIYVDAYDGKTSIEELRRSLGVVDNTAIIWASQKEHAYESAQKFGWDVMSEQKPGVAFVLVTSGHLQGHGLPIWAQVMEKYHGIPCQIIRYSRPEVLARTTRATNPGKCVYKGNNIRFPPPLYNIYSNEGFSIYFKKPVLGWDALLNRQRAHPHSLVHQENGVQATEVVPKGDDNPLQHIEKTVASEQAATQGARVSSEGEDKVGLDTTRATVTEKAVGKKGDGFLNFLERALALYEKA